MYLCITHMTLAEFNILDLKHKSDHVWEWGHLLTSRKDETQNLVLFLVHDFFTEVHINLADNTTKEIRGLSKNELHPEYEKVLNNEDPFVKVFLKPYSSNPKVA